MMNYKYNGKTIEEYKQDTIQELENARIAIATLDVDIEDKEFREKTYESLIATDELGIYIDYLDKLLIHPADTIDVTLSKIYLVLQNISATEKFFNEHMATFYNEGAINQTYIRNIIDFKNLFIRYSPHKSIMFAREIQLRKQLDKKYKDNWKSTELSLVSYMDHIESKSKTKKSKKKVKK